MQHYAERGRRVLMLAKATDGVQGETLPTIEPVALVVLEEKIRESAAATVTYFEDQGVIVKVISGDNPVTVAAVAQRVGIHDAEKAMDARELPEDQDELAEVLETHRRVRTGHAAAEARHGARAAIAGSRGRDDRRRRERHARAEGRRHWCRDGIRQRRGASSCPLRTARERLLGVPIGRGRRSSCDRQRRTRGQPLPHQDLLRDVAGARRRVSRACRSPSSRVTSRSSRA